MITQEKIPFTNDEIKAMVKTIEELRKKYNGALERAKYALTTDMDNSGHWAVNYIFPELKESEDEQMKREILELVSIAGNGNQYEEIKDWLEGQCKNENRALPDEKRMDSAFTNIKCSPNLNKEESMNIQEDYCSYELCKLLKEKGFDEECEWYYPKDCGEKEQLLLDELPEDKCGKGEWRELTSIPWTDEGWEKAFLEKPHYSDDENIQKKFEYAVKYTGIGRVLSSLCNALLDFQLKAFIEQYFEDNKLWIDYKED